MGGSALAGPSLLCSAVNWAGVSGALLALLAVSFADFYVWSSHQGQLALWLVLGLWAKEWSSLASGKGVSAHG